MAYRSWEALLMLKGPVVDIQFCGADDDCRHEDECLRQSSSEPYLRKVEHPYIYPKQVRIIINPFSKPLDDTSWKYKDSDYDAPLVFDQCTKKEGDFLLDSLNVEGVVTDEHAVSCQVGQGDGDDSHGDYDETHSWENCLSLNNANEQNKQRKKQRPCKGQRIRYQKLEDRLMSEIAERPEEFNVDRMNLPPSVSENASRREKLVSKMQSYKHYVLREREIENMLRPILHASHQIDGTVSEASICPALH